MKHQPSHAALLAVLPAPLDMTAGFYKWRLNMLILTRRIDESLIIGNDVTVTVLGVKGNQVRIGVDAPKHVSVHREEIQNRINAEKKRIPSNHERLQ